jgi:hypothetical protein
MVERRFNFGAPYRLVSPEEKNDEEVSLIRPHVAGETHGQSVPADYTGGTFKLELSRVAFAPRNEQALVYVGHYRPDGNGAGFLILLQRRSAQAWDIQATEVIWTIRLDG